MRLPTGSSRYSKRRVSGRSTRRWASRWRWTVTRAGPGWSATSPLPWRQAWVRWASTATSSTPSSATSSCWTRSRSTQRSTTSPGPSTYNPCLECRLCVAACPVGAIAPDGHFDFSACLTHNYREFLGGFVDWVEQVADSRDAQDYRRRVEDSETASLWQSLGFGPSYEAAYCMAARPAGDDVIRAVPGRSQGVSSHGGRQPVAGQARTGVRHLRLGRRVVRDPGFPAEEPPARERRAAASHDPFIPVRPDAPLPATCLGGTCRRTLPLHVHG